MKFKIGFKLIAGFIGVAFVSLIIGIISFIYLNNIKASDDNMYYHMTEPISYLISITESYQRIRVNLREIVLSENEAEAQTYIDKINGYKATLNDNLTLYEKTILTEAHKKIFIDFSIFLN